MAFGRLIPYTLLTPRLTTSISGPAIPAFCRRTRRPRSSRQRLRPESAFGVRRDDLPHYLPTFHSSRPSASANARSSVSFFTKTWRSLSWMPGQLRSSVGIETSHCRRPSSSVHTLITKSFGLLQVARDRSAATHRERFRLTLLRAHRVLRRKLGFPQDIGPVRRCRADHRQAAADPALRQEEQRPCLAVAPHFLDADAFELELDGRLGHTRATRPVRGRRRRRAGDGRGLLLLPLVEALLKIFPHDRVRRLDLRRRVRRSTVRPELALRRERGARCKRGQTANRASFSPAANENPRTKELWRGSADRRPRSGRP